MDNQYNSSRKDSTFNYLSNYPTNPLDQHSNFQEGPTVQWVVHNSNSNPFKLQLKREPIGLIHIPDNEQGWAQIKTDELPELAWKPESYQKPETIERPSQEEEPQEPEYRPTSPYHQGTEEEPQEPEYLLTSLASLPPFDPSTPVFCPTQSLTRPVNHRYCFGCNQECLSRELKFCLGCMIHCPNHRFWYQPNLEYLTTNPRLLTPTFPFGNRAGQETAPLQPEPLPNEDQQTREIWLKLDLLYRLSQQHAQAEPLDLTCPSTRT